MTGPGPRARTPRESRWSRTPLDAPYGCWRRRGPRWTGFRRPRAGPPGGPVSRPRGHRSRDRRAPGRHRPARRRGTAGRRGGHHRSRRRRRSSPVTGHRGGLGRAPVTARRGSVAPLLLAGWLFADLLLGLMIIMLGAQAPPHIPAKTLAGEETTSPSPSASPCATRTAGVAAKATKISFRVRPSAADRELLGQVRAGTAQAQEAAGRTSTPAWC